MGDSIKTTDNSNLLKDDAKEGIANTDAEKDQKNTGKKKLEIILSFTILALLLVHFYTHRPTFAASHKIIGTDEKRVYSVEVAVPPNSLIILDNKQKQKADKNGKAIFNILLGELKRDKNTLNFSVDVPYGLTKKFSYEIYKPTLPITLRIKVSDEIKDNERIKNINIITDPLNNIEITELIEETDSQDGVFNYSIKEYDILKKLKEDPEKLPQTAEIPMQFNSIDVDGQKRTEIISITISTFTLLDIEYPAETVADKVTIKGNAAPNAIIQASDINTDADNKGHFEITVPLNKIGQNTIQISASRPGEKKSTETLTINRLMPEVALHIKEPSTYRTDIVNDRALTIKGTTTSGAVVTVNGQKANIINDEFDFNYTFPWGIEKEYTFHVKAQKTGYRDSIETLTVKKELSYEEKEAVEKDNFIKSSRWGISYKQLSKNSSSFLFQPVAFQGKILEIKESFTGTFMRLSITPLGYGLWDPNEVIAVFYLGTTNNLEGDIITVYGEIQEDFTYETVAGWKLTIPAIKAKYFGDTFARYEY